MKEHRSRVVGWAAFFTLGGALACTAKEEPVMGAVVATAVEETPFVVHEWGTLTTLQGSEGLGLEGLQHEDEVVPAFVHRNVSTQPSPLEHFGVLSRNVDVSGVRTKMETPVVYFYSDRPMRVELEVDFTGGLMTHWYPRHASASPEVTEPGPHDLSSLERSTLAWDLDLVPRDQHPPPEVPDVDASDGWAHARQTGAAFVRTRGDGEDAGEAEHYVFYRGLGRASLPVTVYVNSDERVTLLQRGRVPIEHGFVVEIGQEGGRFLSVGPIAASSVKEVSWERERRLPMSELVHSLSAAVQGALVASGLYADEAEAMVKTWSSAWFRDPGTRFLYLVPRYVTDEILPMRLSPEPDELVRVLVARHEFLTPGREELVERALLDRTVGAKREAAMRDLATFGRFLEPAVRHAALVSTDPRLRASAAEVLETIGHR